MKQFHFLIALAPGLFGLLLMPAPAKAIFSEPAALANSGPVRVNVDIEISEAARLLPKAALQSHMEEHLSGAGIAVVRESADQEMPSVVTASQRTPAQLWVHLDARRITEPPGYLVSIEVSHLQSMILQRGAGIPIGGLDWHESWSQIVRDEDDFPAATSKELDSIIDDFARDYQAANHSATP